MQKITKAIFFESIFGSLFLCVSGTEYKERISLFLEVGKSFFYIQNMEISNGDHKEKHEDYFILRSVL